MNVRNVAAGLAVLVVLLGCGTAGEDRPRPTPPSLSNPSTTSTAGTPSPTGTVAAPCDALKNLQISSVQLSARTGAVGVINYIDYDYLAIAWKGTSSGYRLHGSLHLYNAPPRSLTVSGDHAVVALGGTGLIGYPDTIEFRISNSDAPGVTGIACLGAWAAACPTFTG